MSVRSIPFFFFYSVLAVLSALPADAQYDANDFVRYSVKDGLSDNYVYSIQQDDLGYLWIGTENGLNRFDGHSFRNFYQGTAALPLRSNLVWKLKRFGPHELGIISLSGFQVLNTKDFSFTDYIVPDSTSFTTYLNYALDAVPLPGQSYALASGAGFYVFNKKGEIIYRYDKYHPEDVDKKRILFGRKIIPLNEKNYIVYVDEEGMATYDTEKRSLNEIALDDRQWQSFYHPAQEKIGYWIDQFMINPNEFIFIQQKSDSIVYYDHSLKKSVYSTYPFDRALELDWRSKITQLDETTFALNSYRNGFFIFHLDKTTGKITFDPKKYLPEYRINCLFLDKDKKLWAGTRKGILYQRQASLFIKSNRYPVEPPDNPAPGFSDAFCYKGKIYAGRFSRYNGLIIIDTATKQLEKRVEFYGRDNFWNEVASIQMYHPDTLWIGTNGGILWFDTKSYRYGKVLDEKKYPFAADLAILNTVDKNGDAWFCYMLGGVAGRYHISTRTFTFFTPGTKPALPFSKTKSVVTDAYGDTWLGGHALARWNNTMKSFDTLIKVYGGPNKFNDDILTLSADDKGSLWLHNTDNGLLEYKIKEKKFIAYTVNDGLPSAQIRCLSPVVDNILWLGGVNYLAQFNTATKKTVIYDYRDGLPEEFPGSRKIAYDPGSRKFYLFCSDYLAEFLHQTQAYIDSNKTILIQELIINNKTSLHHPSDTIVLPYTQNDVSVLFNILSFDSPDNYRFEYKLNNTDTWASLGDQRSINLNALQSGSYIVHIKAINKYGKETIKNFTITIKPPFWKTPLFFTAAGLLISLLIWLIYKNRVRQIRQRANIDKLLAQTELKALHSQMNPHFIFNSLNSIREMILNNENREASHYLSKFAQLIRITLDQSGQSFVSLRNTLDYLHRYIEMEKIRNNHFNCTLHVDPELDPDETTLPPMLIQPFIENSIWHGANGSRKMINILVSFKKQNTQLVCTIDDDGIGIDQSLLSKSGSNQLHNPYGIANIQNRIKLLNEKNADKSSVLIMDKKNIPGSAERGTLVTLRLPLEIHAYEKD
ncbi:MAG: histidine kinase [Chitinophagaceae bacterium]|nr:histidine kinase [Chitinophagaceae bacterium]